MGKIIISVAPVCLDASSSTGIWSPEEVAREVCACAKEGAGIVHLHVRDDKGEPTYDISCFERTIDLIRKDSDIIIQGSTGGCYDLSLDERCVSLKDSRVENATLNMGSTNFGEDVYINSLSDIRYWASKMYERGIMPELEIFDGSMAYTALKMQKEGLLTGKPVFALCLGFPSSLRASCYDLQYLCGLIPPNAAWGLVHHGMKGFDLIACAIALGADFVRVGFEDSIYYARNKKAADNAELVREVKNFIGSMGREIASPAEAREILGLKPYNAASEKL